MKANNIPDKIKLPFNKHKTDIGKVKKMAQECGHNIDLIIHHDPEPLRWVPGDLLINPRHDGINYDGMEVLYTIQFNGL